MNIQTPWWKTQLGEAESEAASDAISRGKLSHGIIAEEFEAALSEAFGVPHVTMTTSGSAALVTALVSAGIKPGDEVIVPNRTFIATAHAVQLIGATVRLADTQADIPVIDPQDVERKITDKTRAIIPVHINGCACDIEELQNIADRHRIIIIEDTAQGMFSRNGDRYLGTFGLFGCFSLGVTKLITSGQGGFVLSSDKEAYERTLRMRFHGGETSLDGVFTNFGFNFRITDIQAAIALKQLKRIPDKIKAHVGLYRRYEKVISGLERIDLIPVKIERGELPLWAQVTCKDRNALIKFLVDRNIQAIPTHPNLSDSPHMPNDGPFPNSTFFAETELILPSGPDQDDTSIQATLDALVKFENA